MYVKDNILHLQITKGTDFTLSLASPDLDLTQYTSIRADFKPVRTLDAPPLIRVELGEGIEATADSLTLTVPYGTTSKIKFPLLYMDIKGRIGEASPVLLLQAECKILDTATVV